MTGQLLPLRLLTSSKLLCSYRGAFTFHLRTLTLSSTSSLSASPNQNSAVRCYSIRPARSRDDSRTGFRAGRSAGGGQGKSLIEDEAELSDWVADLSKSSFRLGLSESEDGESDREIKRSGSRNGRDIRVGVRDSGDFSEKKKLRSSSEFSERRSGGFSERNSRGSLSRKQIGRDFEGRGDRTNTRGLSGPRSNRSSVGYPERNSRGPQPKRRFGSELEDEDEDDDEDEEDSDFSSRQKRGSGSSLGSGRRGGKVVESIPRGSQSKRRFDSESEDEEDEEDEEDNDFLSKQKRGRGSVVGSGRRGGKVVDSGYQRKPLSEISEEDDAFGYGDVDFSGDEVEGKKVAMKDSLLKSGSPVELSDRDSGKPVSRSSSGDKDSYLSDTRFDQCSISSLSLKGVKAAGYERMTLVQEATLPIILKGKDVLAKAKTGTGKTVAFLLPAIEIVSKLPAVDRDQKRPPINVLVICPTRELADQAATEANALLKFHPSLGVQVVIGGTRLALEQKRMQANPCQILVATPGRLRDHIENTPGFATRLMGVKVLVLDEADRLLDMGFRKDIEKIVAAVPKQRQTLLFSATVPDEVRQICYIAMKRDHEFVNTVGEGTEETHTQVTQMHLVAPLEKQFPLLYAILSDHIAEDVDYKVIVFCTTAMVTKLVADLLSELKLNVREIHSRKPQSYRTRVSKEFKESKGLILVSSDVSARGVDYPDVTLVVQIGVPADREQYIHRLGRTGRKGKEGEGILLLAPWEEYFLSSIKDLPITQAPMPLLDPDTRKKVEQALGHVEMKNKESAYQAWLGYYNSNKSIGRDKNKLVALANEFSRSMGLDNPPAIAKIVLGKMGLKNVPGLRSK